MPPFVAMDKGIAESFLAMEILCLWIEQRHHRLVPVGTSHEVLTPLYGFHLALCPFLESLPTSYPDEPPAKCQSFSKKKIPLVHIDREQGIFIRRDTSLEMDYHRHIHLAADLSKVILAAEDLDEVGLEIMDNL